ncbi:hypothetical protein PUNSTDRAFT_23143, partial [Punctularia strigosozonata HHB-11173 SS5]
ESSVYEIELPNDLRQRRVHPRFHISKLRPHVPNDDAKFPGREAMSFYDFGQPDELEREVEEIVAHEWDDDEILFLVRWTFGDSS